LGADGLEAALPPDFRLSVQGPQAGGDAQSAQAGDEQHPQALPVAPAGGQGPVRGAVEIGVQPGAPDLQLLFQPGPEGGWGAGPARQMPQQGFPPGGQRLQGDPGAGRIGPVDVLLRIRGPGEQAGEVVLQNGEGGVPQVLVRQGAEKTDPVRGVFAGEKGADFAGVAPCGREQVRPRGGRRGEGGQAGRPQGVSAGESLAPPGAEGLAQPGGGGVRRSGGAKVEACPGRVHRRRRGEAEGNGSADAVPLGQEAVQGGQHMEVPQAQLRLGPAVLAGGEGGDGVVAGFVENLQPEAGARGGGVPQQGLEGIRAGGGVAGGLVVVGDGSIPAHGGAVEGGAPLAEEAAVNEHGAGGGGVEPPPVQHGLGLAGPQKAPAAIAQGLYPGVVVVAVGPPGGVDLPGGDAHAAQGGDQEGGFLPAAPAPAAEDGEGGGGALVLGLIAGVLVAPAVDLQGPLLHAGEVLHPGPEPGVENFPVEGEVLIVDTGEQDVVAENFLLQLPAPVRRLPEREGMVREAEEQLRRIAVQIALGQVFPEERHGPLLFRAQVRQEGVPAEGVSFLHIHLHSGTAPGSSRISSTVSTGSGSTGLGPRSAKTMSG